MRGELPRSLRALLRTMGANNAASTLLLSYLLFERGFTRELIALGYEDARARAEEIRAFLALRECAPVPGDAGLTAAARSCRPQLFCSESCRVRTCG